MAERQVLGSQLRTPAVGKVDRHEFEYKDVTPTPVRDKDVLKDNLMTVSNIFKLFYF